MRTPRLALLLAVLAFLPWARKPENEFRQANEFAALERSESINSGIDPAGWRRLAAEAKGTIEASPAQKQAAKTS